MGSRRMGNDGRDNIDFRLAHIRGSQKENTSIGKRACESQCENYK
jgi:hypothetical protein